jgi:fumarate reductase subunit D
MFMLLEIGNSLNNIAMIYPLQILLVGVLLLLGLYVLYHSTGLSRGFNQRRKF